MHFSVEQYRSGIGKSRGDTEFCLGFSSGQMAPDVFDAGRALGAVFDPDLPFAVDLEEVGRGVFVFKGPQFDDIMPAIKSGYQKIRYRMLI